MFRWRSILQRGWSHRGLQEGHALRNGEFQGVLCFTKYHEPASVDPQLTAPDMEKGRGSRTFSSSVRVPVDCEHPGDVSAETVRKLCQHGELGEAVECLGVLVRTDFHVSKHLFCTVLRECVARRDLPLGRRVHALTLRKGYESDTFLCNHILRMYSSYGLLQEAVDAFSLMSKPDAFTWSAIIAAHVKHGQDKQAVQLYQQMRRSSVKPDGHVVVAALQACVRGGDLKSGQQVHADMLASEFEQDLFVTSCLVDMYAKCGSLEDARRVFDALPGKDVVTWTAMIAAYSQRGMGQQALALYRTMEAGGMVVPNSVTFLSILQACASVGPSALEKGKQLHAEIRERGLQADVFVVSSLVDMYAKCGSVEDARDLFDGLDHKTVVTWSAMIAGYTQQGMGLEALHLYRAMQEEGMTAPNAVTFVCLLQACSIVGTSALETGRQLHAHVREQGFHSDLLVATSLVNMYAKCGSMAEAQRVFDGLGQKDVVTWTCLIAGYCQGGMGQEALRLYSAMQEEDVAVPDSVTFVCLLQACASLGIQSLENGRQLHTQIRERGLEADTFVANSLVNMYAKCGSVEDARGVFDGLAEKDVVTWNALIAGYSQHGMGQEALCLYRAMQEEGVAAPDSVTFVCLLQASAHVAALHLGQELHMQIKEQELEDDVLVAGSLISMYGKCGSMAHAREVFEALSHRDDVVWNALIAGYSREGDCEAVLDLFHKMRETGVHPAGLTFLHVLTVCSHTGLVKVGREYFDAMSNTYGISPTLEHYTCMVDLLGRAGHLDEALTLIKAMPTPPDAAVWRTLLGACQKWSNVEVGQQAFHGAVSIDSHDPSAYVLMSNIYTSSQMWEQALEMHSWRQGNRAWKQPGQSWWTDMDGLVHSFLVGDTVARST